MVDPNHMKEDTRSGQRPELADQGNLSIVIMDSGMGGLSICADMVNGLRAHRTVARAAITYFNAWPEQGRGYNALPDDAERLRVFDRALIGMQAFRPDMVYIACNTLSILYPQTEFSRTAAIPVTGIVDFGVDLIHGHLSRQADSQVIILGTLTTIGSETHKKALMARGIDSRRVVCQACDQLATEIEKDPYSSKVRSMTDAFVRQAAARLADQSAPVFAALCCTHFGYAEAAFKNSLETRLGRAATILNPNDSMSAHFFEAFNGQPKAAAEIDLRVVSRIMWSDQKVSAIARVLKAASPETAFALMHYRYDPELFSF